MQDGPPTGPASIEQNGLVHCGEPGSVTASLPIHCWLCLNAVGSAACCPMALGIAFNCTDACSVCSYKFSIVMHSVSGRRATKRLGWERLHLMP